MPLKNSRTTVSVERTGQEIQKLLLRVKARRIVTDFEGDRPTGVSFLVDTAVGEREYALPIRIEQVRKALLRDGFTARIANSAQAERIAWRIAKDWLSAQVALIEMGMSDLSEIMLPFQLTETGQTIYQALLSRRLTLPPGREQV